jgi:hypothetical protein
MLYLFGFFAVRLRAERAVRRDRLRETRLPKASYCMVTDVVVFDIEIMWFSESLM